MAERKIQEAGYAYGDCDQLYQVLLTFTEDIHTEINKKSILLNCVYTINQ